MFYFQLVKRNVTRQSLEYLGIEKVEINKNYVNFYFNELDAGRRCFYFDVEQNIEVSSPKPAFVKVYDYYETELNLLQEYGIKTICGTKEELPFISAEEYLMGIQDGGPMVQVRVPVDVLWERARPPRPDNEGEGSPGASLQTCPVCSSSDVIDPKSESYKNLVCNSPKIYKVLSGRNGMYNMKIKANIRAKPKIKIESFANYSIADKCQCQSLQLKDQKLLIFTAKNTFVEENKKFTLDNRSTVLVWNKLLEKKINKIVHKRRGGCNK